jgi:TolB-like protein
MNRLHNKTLLLVLPVSSLFAQGGATFKADKPVVIQADNDNPVAPSFKKLIFLDFYNESNDPNVKWLTDSIGESIFELTKNKYKYARIESKVWREYAKSKDFKPQDFYDVDKLQAMGFALKADGIIFGKFRSSPENIEISGKILSVVDKDIVAEKNITVPFSSQMFEDVQDVSETLGSRIKDLFYPSDRGALWRSALLPGWGQFYKQRKTAGYIYSGVIGTGAAFSLFSLVMLQSTKQQYASYNPDHVITPQGEFGIKDPAAAQAEFARLEAKADQWYQITMISAGITLGIYLWHLFDAWFFEGNYVELGKASAMEIHSQESLFGSRLRISSGREALSLRLDFLF